MKCVKRLSAWLVLLMLAPVAWASQVTVIDNNSKPLANMVVYLKPSITVDLSAFPIPETPQIVRQKDKQFSPYILVMRAGSKVAITNEDNISHHVYSAAGVKRFSIKMPKQSKSDVLQMTKAGEVALGCNVHDWMSSYLKVVDTPFYGLTDKDGNIHFNSVPSGEYQLVVWHPQLQAEAQQQTSQVTLPKKDPLTIKVTADILPIPQQKTIDEFEFWESY
ncbi:carboxypeptidase regulatory-like domain-containing protein [Parashewanella tropica]|uniref:carboxypeptidase regulatory-like domain-containing protein n=1 Tax=Parashewanella tropica TaxID=2547970 RepID=UPI001059244B|nr:carboxypeptidase regulatory-like domain-containing protein [Parashewanella tropica]